MSNTVKAKQKKTIIICAILSIALLAGSIFLIVDGLLHMNDPYKIFGNVEFAKAYASALGRESVRDITDEDLAKVESLTYYWSIGTDSNNNYQTYAYPVVILGYKTMTDIIISNSEEEPAADSYVTVSYPVTEVADITAFPNLRVLRTFDLTEVSSMNEGCSNTQYMAQMSQYYNQMGYNMDVEAIYLEDVIKAAALTNIKKLDQLKSLSKLEQLSLEYTGITSLEGIQNFPNLTKLDIGFTSVEGDDLSALSSVTNLTELTLVSLKGITIEENNAATESSEASKAESSEEASKEETSKEESSKEETSEEEEKHTHAGLTDISAISGLTNLKTLNISGNAIVELGALDGLTNLENFVANSNCIEKLDSLSKLTNLKNVSVVGNHITASF